MVLASQAARPLARHRFMSSTRRRKRQPWLIAAIGFGAVISLTCVIFQAGSGGAPTAPPVNDGEAELAGARKNATAPKSSESPVIQMGALGMNGATPATEVNQPPLPEPRPEPALPPAPIAKREPPKPDAPVIESAAKTPAPDIKPTETAAATDASPKVTPPPAPRAPERLTRGLELATRDPVGARRLLTASIMKDDLTDAEAQQAREALKKINETLVFSPTIVPGDTLAASYTIESGDNLQKVARKLSVNADWRLLKRINKITDERKLREGQRIKVIAAPFHAVVSKGQYRLDLYLGDGEDRVFVRSFAVGLGEYNSTPTGLFRVRPKSKLINPQWTNPRTGEHFSADDPKNPIGDRWIGLEGIEEATRNFAGYGIHGTIEPDSIGQQMSMGCVRMRTEDVELIYDVLTEPNSVVDIRP